MTYVLLAEQESSSIIQNYNKQFYFTTCRDWDVVILKNCIPRNVYDENNINWYKSIEYKK